MSSFWWRYHNRIKIKAAEGVRFELTRPFGLPVFKTGAINRSATPPGPCVRGGKFITPLLRLLQVKSRDSDRSNGVLECWSNGEEVLDIVDMFM